MRYYLTYNQPFLGHLSVRSTWGRGAVDEEGSGEVIVFFSIGFLEYLVYNFAVQGQSLLLRIFVLKLGSP